MKNINRIISGIVVAALLVFCLAGIPSLPLKAEAAGSSFSAVGGWYEALYAEIEGISDDSVTSVSYSGPVSGQLMGQDLEYLVRAKGSAVRIDIPGLKPGNYTLTVVAGGVSYTQSNIQVTAYDRSGYAHWNYTQGVGAYNDDGTVKGNAVILYVTEESKNSVSVTAGGITVTGIGNILNTGGKSSKNGSLANTNGDILQKLADEGKPLVVRIVGRVTKPAGVTAWGSYDYGGNPDDNGGMAYMKRCKNITIEGIGNDATIDGWGFGIGCNDGDYAKGYNRNFEFRNLTFRNVPEDCIGISGRGGTTLTDPIEHSWVHNCAFYGPSNLPDASDDQDKAEGDGAMDYKWGRYHTMSYNYFEGYHKTHLIGGDDNNLQYHITWHHNHWKACESRGPLGRQANMHLYNNLIEGQTSYCMRMRANCYIFSEYNTYINCNKVSSGTGGGVCKSYMNTFTGCTGTTASDLKIVTNKGQRVTSGNLYANFDTDAALGYVSTGDYLLQTDAAAAAQTVREWAGPMDHSSKASQDDPPATPEINESSYIHDFTENGLSSSFYAISGNLSTSKGTVSYNGLTLTRCLKMESATAITFTAPSAGTLILVFHEIGYNGAIANQSTVSVDGSTKSVGADNTLVLSLEAGKHTIKKGNKQIFLYYMVFTPAEEPPHTHSYENGVCTGCGEKAPGVTLSGSYKAFGEAGNSLSIQLFQGSAEDVAYTFTNKNAAANSGEWSIKGIIPGSYTVRVTKLNHVTREYELEVGSNAISLDVEVWLIGDVTGDGLVNFSDYSKVLSQSKKPNSQILTDYAFLCGDVNADGAINFSDYSKILSQAKGKGALWQ